MSKTQIEFSWDWKESPDVHKIIKSVKKIFDETGKFPNCYNVNTKQDCYAILLSINEYTDSDKIRKIWNYLWVEKNCSKKELMELKEELEKEGFVLD